MTGDIARRFHAATEHRPGRPAEGGPFDPRIEPAKVKRYPDLDGLPLPDDWSESEAGAAAVLSGARGDQGRGSNLGGVARLLFLSHGVSRTFRGRRFRTAPSAGALYPIELYVVCAALTGLRAGVYHHDPERRTLTAIREGDHRGALARACADPDVATRPVSFVLTGVPWRTTWKYGPRGYRHLFWDAGVIIANTLAATRAVGLPARVTGAFVDRGVGRLLDLGDHQPFDEWPLAVVPIGPSGAEAPSGDGPEPLRHDVAALSDERVTWHEISEVHRAGDLDDTAAIGAWRDRVAEPSLAPATDPAPPPEGDGVTIDQVILRRGSTRRFDPDRTVPEPALRWGLPVALRPIDGDLAPDGRTPLGAHVAVHAVEGVDPGGYRWAADGLEPVVDGQTREATAHLCLDQALGGTAAFTAFLGADLDPILDVLGARGYRTAHLASAVAAGRLQLAAFASGLGGTGLTFYDDEVRRHFGAGGDPLLVAAIGIPDYDPRSGTRPDA